MARGPARKPVGSSILHSRKLQPVARQQRACLALGRRGERLETIVIRRLLHQRRQLTAAPGGGALGAGGPGAAWAGVGVPRYKRSRCRAHCCQPALM
jgi:hypothetical protein